MRGELKRLPVLHVSGRDDADLALGGHAVEPEAAVDVGRRVQDRTRPGDDLHPRGSNGDRRRRRFRDAASHPVSSGRDDENRDRTAARCVISQKRRFAGADARRKTGARDGQNRAVAAGPARFGGHIASRAVRVCRHKRELTRPAGRNRRWAPDFHPRDDSLRRTGGRRRDRRGRRRVVTLVARARGTSEHDHPNQGRQSGVTSSHSVLSVICAAARCRASCDRSGRHRTRTARSPAPVPTGTIPAAAAPRKARSGRRHR